MNTVKYLLNDFGKKCIELKEKAAQHQSMMLDDDLLPTEEVEEDMYQEHLENLFTRIKERFVI